VLRETEEVTDVRKKLHNFQLSLLETNRVTLRVPFEKLIVPQLVKKFAQFFKTSNPLLVPVLSQINPVRAPNPAFNIHFNIIPCRLGLQTGFFLQCSHLNHAYMFHMARKSYPHCSDHPHNIW